MRRNFHIVSFIFLACSASGQESCPAGKECSAEGQCQEFKEKRDLLKSLPRGSTPYNNQLNELKGLVCNKSEKRVCCSQESCPAGKECRPEEKCPEFKEEKNKLKSLTRGSTQYSDKKNELKGLICNKSERRVCCSQQQLKKGSNSPSWVPSMKEGCGFGFGSSGFVVGGNDTELGEFPWSVLLGRKISPSKTKWNCGGTLINEWYVLTAAHCRNNMDMVRVGEWKVVDTSKIKPDRDRFTCTAYKEDQCKNIRCSEGCRIEDGEVDCDLDRGGSEICSERHQDVEVDEVEIHEDYQTLRSGMVVNDIALVKLRHPVQLNKFVVPICLPDENENSMLQLFGEPGKDKLISNGKPIVVGWGKTYKDSDSDIHIVSSAKQQKLEMPVVSNCECAARWGKLSAAVVDDIRIGEHLCAGGEEGKDSCNGDSGGSLIGRDGEDNPYILLGVVSAGTKICGSGTPAIFTRVAHYREWILKHLV